MKKFFILSMSVLLLFSCKTEETEENNQDGINTDSESVITEYHIKKDESILNWKGTMIGVYSHEGTMNFKESSFKVKDGKVAEGTFIIDMFSMIATDDEANYVNAPREKLIEHLQADDFFATEKFPESKFVITSSEANQIKGKLTIRGISNVETVTDVVISEADGNLNASGKLVFDRQKYEVAYESSMKDMVLSDDIELNITLKGKKK